jgi:hypothetical protein
MHIDTLMGDGFCIVVTHNNDNNYEATVHSFYILALFVPVKNALC